MFSITYNENSQIVNLTGNFDASGVEEATSLFEKIEDTITVDMSNLNFISSSGIGVLVMTYRRLKEKEKNIYLVNLNDNIKKVFKVSLLDSFFIIK